VRVSDWPKEAVVAPQEGQLTINKFFAPRIEPVDSPQSPHDGADELKVEDDKDSITLDVERHQSVAIVKKEKSVVDWFAHAKPPAAAPSTPSIKTEEFQPPIKSDPFASQKKLGPMEKLLSKQAQQAADRQKRKRESKAISSDPSKKAKVIDTLIIDD
jgi:hypothetical protein